MQNIAECQNITTLEPSNFMQNIAECRNIATLEPSNFMQNIAECQNIATLGGKRLIAYSKLGLGLIIFQG